MELTLDPDWIDAEFDPDYLETLKNSFDFAGNAVDGYSLAIVPDFNLEIGTYRF